MNDIAIAIILLIVVVSSLDTEKLCSCMAIKLGFKIDCADKAQMMTAQTALSACSKTACQTDSVCKKWFLIAQSHHDYCFEDDLPTDLEKVKIFLFGN